MRHLKNFPPFFFSRKRELSRRFSHIGARERGGVCGFLNTGLWRRNFNQYLGGELIPQFGWRMDRANGMYWD